MRVFTFHVRQKRQFAPSGDRKNDTIITHVEARRMEQFRVIFRTLDHFEKLIRRGSSPSPVGHWDSLIVEIIVIRASICLGEGFVTNVTEYSRNGVLSLRHLAST